MENGSGFIRGSIFVGSSDNLRSGSWTFGYEIGIGSGNLEIDKSLNLDKTFNQSGTILGTLSFNIFLLGYGNWECASASSIRLCIAGLSWLWPGGRGVGYGIGVFNLLGSHEDVIYACMYAIFLHILLLIFCYLMHLLLIRTHEIEGSEILS